MRNNSTVLDESLEELVSGGIGLKRSSTLKVFNFNKESRRHVRGNTTTNDNASVDSGKSTREDTANKIKNAFEELEALRKRNEELEKIVKETPKTSEVKPTINQTWSEIEVS